MGCLSKAYLELSLAIIIEVIPVLLTLLRGDIDLLRSLVVVPRLRARGITVGCVRMRLGERAKDRAKSVRC